MRNPFDAAIAALAPRMGVKRARARLQLAAFRAYDAAAKTRRTAGWKATSTSHTAETEFSLETLRNRSRELVRNNEYAKTAVGIWQRNAIGAGFKLRAIGGGKRLTKKAVDLWDEWAGTTQIDPAGRLTFSGLGGLGMREVVEAGEFLIRRRWRRADGSLAVPLQLQLLEADHLDTTKRLVHGKDVETSRIWQGVQYSARGRLQGYWLYPEHPGDARTFRRKSFFVPARDIIHVFRAERIGQVRGVPWGASAMIRTRKIGDYEDAELERKVVASMFVGFVHDIEAGLGDGLGPKSSEETNLEMQPATWEELPPGKDITFSKPPIAEGYKEYMDVSLHAVARGYDVTYEDLTGDLSMTNFSSARLGRLVHAEAVLDFQRNTWVPLVCDRVWQWFLEAAAITGKVTKPIKAQWTAPAPRLADPKTEISTANLRVRNGFISLSGAIRELGQDPDHVFEELAEDMKRLDDLGLVLDSDARQATSSGADRDDLEEKSKTRKPEPGEDPNAPPTDPETRSAALDAALLNGQGS